MLAGDNYMHHIYHSCTLYRTHKIYDTMLDLKYCLLENTAEILFHKRFTFLSLTKFCMVCGVHKFYKPYTGIHKKKSQTILKMSVNCLKVFFNLICTFSNSTTLFTFDVLRDA